VTGVEKVQLILYGCSVFLFLWALVPLLNAALEAVGS
jgi:hypothetical protein